MSGHPDQPTEETMEAEQRAREKDPHGASVADEAADHAPKGYPTDDRHRSETATER